jgi:hypothetical protein
MKIAISADVTRIAEGNSNLPSQNAQALWFKTILEPLLENNTGIEINIILSKDKVWGDKKTDFDIKEFYKIVNLPMNADSWAKIFSGDIENIKEAEEFLLSYYKNFNMVLGFELPDFLINLFNKNDITYIDGFLHPIRFYKDLIICFRTNCATVEKNLLTDKYFFSEKDIYNNTNFERARLYSAKGLGLEINSCLFLGQTNIDKSLIKNGEVLSVFAFKKEFGEICSKYSKVYYKIHPLMKENKELIQYLGNFDKVKIIDDTRTEHKDFNMYALIAQQNIKKVYSLSSSGCYEAKFLKKEAEWLTPYPFEILKEKNKTKLIKNNQTSPYIPIRPDMLFISAFWKDVLNTELINESHNIEYQFGQIRKSIGSSWGYDFFK